MEIIATPLRSPESEAGRWNHREKPTDKNPQQTCCLMKKRPAAVLASVLLSFLVASAGPSPPSSKSPSPSPPLLPTFPDLAAAGPAFVVTRGDPVSPAGEILCDLHRLYASEGAAKMVPTFHAREWAREAHLLTHPEKPQDVTLRFWKRTLPTARGTLAQGQEVEP